MTGYVYYYVGYYQKPDGSTVHKQGSANSSCRLKSYADIKIMIDEVLKVDSESRYADTFILLNLILLDSPETRGE